MCSFTKKSFSFSRPPTGAPTLDPAGGLLSPRPPVFFYVPPIILWDRRPWIQQCKNRSVFTYACQPQCVSRAQNSSGFWPPDKPHSRDSVYWSGEGTTQTVTDGDIAQTRSFHARFNATVAYSPANVLINLTRLPRVHSDIIHPTGRKADWTDNAPGVTQRRSHSSQSDRLAWLYPDS